MVDSRSYADLPDRPWVLAPVGSFEQHGPHLPLHTDTTIATAVAGARILAEPPDADDHLTRAPR